MFHGNEGVHVHEVSVTIGEKLLLDKISFDAEPGRVLGLIGPNGAGKSTLLSAICGDLPYAGEIYLNGINPRHSSAKVLAQNRAMMLQDVNVSFSFLVRDVVAMGRRPWQRTDRRVKDEKIIDDAMKMTEVDHLSYREVSTLSGGEKARVAMARVLAQETPIVMFDEPTAALDIRHQEQALGIVRGLAKQGATVVIILHDLNAAASYCDDVLCLKEGKLISYGPVKDVYTSENLSRVYGWPIEVIHEGKKGLHVIPRRGEIQFFKT